MYNLLKEILLHEYYKRNDKKFWYSKFHVRSLQQYEEASNRENLKFGVESLFQGQVHLKILENANFEDNSAPAKDFQILCFLGTQRTIHVPESHMK